MPKKSKKEVESESEVSDSESEQEEKVVKKSKPKESKESKEKKENPWLIHVNKVKEKNKGKSYKEVLLLASKSYKPVKKV